MRGGNRSDDLTALHAETLYRAQLYRPRYVNLPSVHVDNDVVWMRDRIQADDAERRSSFKLVFFSVACSNAVNMRCDLACPFTAASAMLRTTARITVMVTSRVP